MENLRKLEQWLSEPCDEMEVMVNPIAGGGYVPIDIINKKIKFAESMFGAKFKFRNFSHAVYNLPYSINISGSIEVELTCFNTDDLFSDEALEATVDNLVGAATFNINDYTPNTHWGATCKSLAISNALLKYPQFGGHLNRQSVDFANPKGQGNGQIVKRKADFIIQKQMDNAQTMGDIDTIDKLNELYDFTHVGTE